MKNITNLLFLVNVSLISISVNAANFYYTVEKELRVKVSSTGSPVATPAPDPAPVGSCNNIIISSPSNPNTIVEFTIDETGDVSYGTTDGSGYLNHTFAGYVAHYSFMSAQINSTFIWYYCDSGTMIEDGGA